MNYKYEKEVNNRKYKFGEQRKYKVSFLSDSGVTEVESSTISNTLAIILTVNTHNQDGD